MESEPIEVSELPVTVPVEIPVLVPVEAIQTEVPPIVEEKEETMEEKVARIKSCKRPKRKKVHRVEETNDDVVIGEDLWDDDEEDQESTKVD